MNNPFTFETEQFDYAAPGEVFETTYPEQESWEAPYSRELQFEGGAACPGYQRGEIQKSYTAQGHLPADVIQHPRGLLIADFGVNWRTPRQSLKRDKTLQEWLATMPKVIASNPTTSLRILGFSDCVGKEANNRFLRHGRAVRVVTLLNQMAGSGPQWAAIKSKVKLVGAGPIGEYVADNGTIEGRAQNRSVLIESTRTIDYEPDVVQACLITPRRAATYKLLGVIPNVPDYQRYVPLDYRLNAKQIIGEVAQDISKNGEKAHFWLELIHWGIIGAEIFAEGSLLVAGLAIAGPVLMFVGSFLALGIPCVEAAEEEAKNWAATGFSRGVVIGADKRSAKLLKDYFGNDYFPPNHFCPQARDVAIANYKMGLLVGFVQGRLLCPNQRKLFWSDLGRRMGDQSYRGDSKRWGRREWVDWYVSAGANFRKYHLI